MRPLATIADIRNAFAYDPLTGRLDWAVAPSRNIPAGSEAGTTAHADGYRLVGFRGVKYAAHRLIWAFVYGYHPPEMVDHINGDKLDNRLANLRLANMSHNQANRGAPRNSATGIKGVSRRPDGRWIAMITARRRTYYLGLFASIDEAKRAYDDRARELFGEFARVVA